MKTKILLLLLVISSSLIAQWSSDVRLTNNGANSYTSWNSQRSIAVSGNYVHVVWHDERDGNSEIYYKRSTDNGVTWGNDTRMTNNTGFSGFPSVTAIGNYVYIVWLDNALDNNYEIYCYYSTNNGTSWSSFIRLTNNSASSEYPCVSASGSYVHVVWHDNRDGNYEIYYKRSTDNGVTWGNDTRMTNNSGASEFPSIATLLNYVYIVWQDNTLDNNTEIYCYYSTNNGTSWSSFIRLTNNPAASERPCVSAAGNDVHVVWHDKRDGTYEEIYYKRSTNNGVNWGSDTRMTNNSAFSTFPSIVALGNYVGLVWEDNSVDNNYEIYHYFSYDRGTTWSNYVRLTNNPFSSVDPHIAAFGSGVHVVWRDDRDGNNEIYYKRNPTGTTAVQSSGTEIPGDYRLSQNYPNPFNPVTMIEFDIPKSSYVRLKVYDILGREISRVVDQMLEAGRYTVDFDASELSSGTYFYRIEASDASAGSAQLFRDVRKMVVVK